MLFDWPNHFISMSILLPLFPLLPLPLSRRARSVIKSQHASAATAEAAAVAAFRSAAATAALPSASTVGQLHTIERTRTHYDRESFLAKSDSHSVSLVSERRRKKKEKRTNTCKKISFGRFSSSSTFLRCFSGVRLAVSTPISSYFVTQVDCQSVTKKPS